MTPDPFKSRSSDSTFVAQVWEANFTANGELTVTADGTWDMVFGRIDDQAECIITGPTTGPVTYRYYAGQWALGIQFRHGVYLPGLPAREVINAHRPLKRNEAELFELKGCTFTLPTYDNAELLVQLLADQRVLARDVVVERTLKTNATTLPKRTLQRHFTSSTGLPLTVHQQINRAQQAAKLLCSGMPIAQVAQDCGYYDQAHLARSLKQFLGVTPTRLKSEK